jgi:precorrin-3B synthase
MNAPLRRGACPGLSAPMQTGDGWLVRLLPIGTIPLAAFAELCAAARTFGNGIVEITARGSIQVRGLTAASVPRFAVAVGALGVAAEDGIPVHVNPLTGLDADEILDAGKIAADLRDALTRSGLSAQLSLKVSVTIDGGGALGLDELAADVRLRAELVDGGVALRASVGGDSASTMDLGFIAPSAAVEAGKRLLEVIAQRGRHARARNIIAGEGIDPFGLTIRDLFSISARPHERPPELEVRPRANEPTSVIGTHGLRDGSLARSVGLAFGHADAMSLEALAEAAKAAGATGLRAAPGRAVIIIGFSPGALSAFTVDAERLGFVVRADDPRLHVIACAGAPICASAHIAARAIAPRIAAESAEFLGKSFIIHLSGCAKGCAHPAPSALTVVGTPAGGALVHGGTARDTPFAVAPAEQLTAAIARAVRAGRHETRHV